MYALGPSLAPSASTQALRFVLRPKPGFDPSIITRVHQANVRLTETGSLAATSAIAQNAVWLLPPTAAKPARIVYKDESAIHFAGAYRPTGLQRLMAYGCGFSAASFSLTKADTGSSHPLTANVAPSQYAQRSLRCSESEPAAQRVDLALSEPLPAPGVYYLRVSVAPSGEDSPNSVRMHEDSYPLVIYSSTPTLATPEVSGSLQQHRRFAKAAVGTDVFGRKYVYVIGGDDLPAQINPATTNTSNVKANYEFTPVQRDHTLLPFATGNDAPVALTSPTGASLTQTYGSSVVGDSSHLYLLGGTSNGTGGESDAILAFTVTHPLTQMPNERLGLLKPQPITQTLHRSVYGHDSTLLVLEDQRRIVTTGGKTGPNLTLLFELTTLGPSGALWGPIASTGTVTSGPRLSSEQAFHTLAYLYGPTGRSLMSYGGIGSVQAAPPVTPKDAVFRYEVPSALTFGAFAAPTTVTSPLYAAPFWRLRLHRYGHLTSIFGESIIQAGASVFAFGSARYEYVAVVDDYVSDLRGGVLASDGFPAALPLTSTAATLPARQALSAAIALPPNAFLFSGIRCDPARMTNTCLDNNIELLQQNTRITITP